MRQQQGLEQDVLDVLGSGGAAGQAQNIPKTPQGMGDQLRPQAEPLLQGCEDEVGVSDEGLCSAGGKQFASLIAHSQALECLGGISVAGFLEGKCDVVLWGASQIPLSRALNPQPS